jgi:hypothetical protein
MSEISFDAERLRALADRLEALGSLSEDPEFDTAEFARLVRDAARRIGSPVRLEMPESANLVPPSRSRSHDFPVFDLGSPPTSSILREEFRWEPLISVAEWTDGSKISALLETVQTVREEYQDRVHGYPDRTEVIVRAGGIRMSFDSPYHSLRYSHQPPSDF